MWYSRRKRHTSGHIFQGRFKAHLVEDECYRSRLSRYIHLNPIRTKAFLEVNPDERQNYLREFKWSSYRPYLGIHKQPEWLICRPVLSCWGKKKREQIQNYASYVEEGLLKNIDSPLDDLVEQTLIGSDRFIDRIKREYLLKRSGDKREQRALIHFQKSFSFTDIINHIAQIYRVDQESIIKRKSGHREARRVGMYFACVYCRHSNPLSELAARFSVSVSALTQARDKVKDSSSKNLQKIVKK